MDLHLRQPFSKAVSCRSPFGGQDRCADTSGLSSIKIWKPLMVWRSETHHLGDKQAEKAEKQKKAKRNRVYAEIPFGEFK